MTKPYSNIRYKTIVENINMTDSQCDDVAEFWKTHESSGKKYRYVRLRLLKRVDTPLLSFDELCKNGLKNAPQKGMKLNGKLLDYIEKILEGDSERDRTDDINEPMSARSLKDENGMNKYICGRCGTVFIMAKRCPECGQLIKYNEVEKA